MNILFSSDDNYARHMGVAIYSILSHNEHCSKIRFFIVDNNISVENKNNIETIVLGFNNSDLLFIPFSKWTENLHLNMIWPISISAYARLFIGEMLPLDIDRVLYLDSDIIVNNDLLELWNIDLGDNVIGAVQDQVSDKIKVGVGLSSNEQYFNSGVLLINLKKWREIGVGTEAIKFIQMHNGRVLHHDQGVLNGLLKSAWFKLPLKYNVMTIHYIMSQRRIQDYYNDYAIFYENKEIQESTKYPTILHFTPSFTSRPWERGCKHPLSYLYLDALHNTPWANHTLDKVHNPWYIRLINWFYYYYSKR